MSRSGFFFSGLFFLGFCLPVRAGLYYSGETFAALPSQWRGFLLDQRTLRNIAVKNPVSPARKRYLEAASGLEKKTGLSADDWADLGALYIRLGNVNRAVEILRKAQREHPEHFRLVANLGTAWQLEGNLSLAAEFLQQAVRLAPPKWRQAEECHLKLVRLRLKEGKAAVGLDDLFGVRFAGPGKSYEPGKWSEAEIKKLPAEAVGLAQQLALWLPQDGRLLWLLAELANGHGDIKTAAAIMDGCVTQFGLNDPELRGHRKMIRAAADKLPKGTLTGKSSHQVHVGSLVTRSKRPLVTRLDLGPLPPIHPTGLNSLPWELLAQTSVDAKFRPTFAKYLRDLDGKRVTLTGFMQPLGEDIDLAGFMFIEYPVGCWYCEMPEVTSIIYVELEAGKTIPYRRDLVRITGRLHLNPNDPEDFLYTIQKATVADLD